MATGSPRCRPRILYLMLNIGGEDDRKMESLHMMIMMTIFERGFIVPTSEKSSCYMIHQKGRSQQKRENLCTPGNPRLNPIPANADTSSNINENILNHLLLWSIRFPRSMIATIKIPHTSHQISISSKSTLEVILYKDQNNIPMES